MEDELLDPPGLPVEKQDTYSIKPTENLLKVPLNQTNTREAFAAPTLCTAATI